MLNLTCSQRNVNWNNNEAYFHRINNEKTFHTNKEIPFQIDKI